MTPIGRCAIKMLAAPVLAGVVLYGTACIAQSNAASGFSAQSVKAAYLYKFAGYVRWPEAAAKTNAPIVIGVLGADDFAQLLTRLTVGHTINNRSIDVRSLKDSDSISRLDILFVGRSERRRLRKVLALLHDRPVLTVTDVRGAIDEGSIINFVVRGRRVRFEVSLYAARQSRLQVSSRLLAVAEHVYQGPE